MTDDYGDWIEEYVREIAASAGVPDFVFKPLLVPKGGSTREVGDSLLWVGHQLAIVSVKSRDPGIGSDSIPRRDSWMAKHVKKAISQINGTYRMLTTTSGLVLKSERGVLIPWDIHHVDVFTGVVVVDHPDPWDFEPDVTDSRIPTIVLALDDWLTLHERYASTAAVIRFVTWRARNGLPSLPLEAEKDIIASVHAAEEDLPLGAPIEVKPGAWERAWRDRPEIFFGTSPDHKYAKIVDNMIAGAADMDPLYTSIETTSDYLYIIEFLDRISPFPRVEFGKGVVKKCQQVGATGEWGAMLSILPEGVIVFLSDPADREQRIKLLRSLTAARHSQFMEATGISGLVTLGIATEPIPTTGRSHDFCLVQATFDLTESEKSMRDEIFGAIPPELAQSLLSRYRGMA